MHGTYQASFCAGVFVDSSRLGQLTRNGSLQAAPGIAVQQELCASGCPVLACGTYYDPSTRSIFVWRSGYKPQRKLPCLKWIRPDISLDSLPSPEQPIIPRCKEPQIGSDQLFMIERFIRRRDQPISVWLLPWASRRRDKKAPFVPRLAIERLRA